jgi:hypothetical protein
VKLGLAAAAAVTLAGSSAWAHKPSDAHLRLAVQGERVDGHLDIAVRDLDGALAIDGNGDGDITWGELSAAAPRIKGYLAERLGFATASASCPIEWHDAALIDLTDGSYWSVPLTARCPAKIERLAISYRLLFDVDALHRGLVHVAGAGARTLIIRDAAPVFVSPSDATSIAEFIEEGVWHIWHGIDHLLFLTCLILPAVYIPRHPRAGVTAPATERSLRAVAVEVFEIVTAFTLAHSITLVISAIGLVQLPSRFIETAIAVSVVAAAVNNLVRAVDARWAVAFSLGLLHGFGFSNVLVDLGLPSHELIGALLGFNLGVELGQAVFVILLLPALYLLRRTIWYRLLLWGGSASIAVVASIWSYQRWCS